MIGPAGLTERRLIVIALLGISVIAALRRMLGWAVDLLSLRIRGVGLSETSRILALIDQTVLLAAILLAAAGLLAVGRIVDQGPLVSSRWMRTAATWVPTRTRDAVLAFLLLSVAMVVVQGWAFIPNLGNDVTVYHGEIWRDLDNAQSVWDVLRPASGLPGLVVVYGSLGRVIGRELTALVLTVMSITALVVGLWTVLRQTGVSDRVAGFLAPLSLTFVYGAKKSRFDLGICNSGCTFMPSPRFIGISVVVLAIGLLLAERYVASTITALLAASIHALDGFIPMILMLVAGLVVFARTKAGPSESQLRRAQMLLSILALILLMFVRNYNWIPFHEGGVPDIASAVVLTPSLVLLGTAGWWLMSPTTSVDAVRPRLLLKMLGVLLPFGLLFAMQRSPSTESDAIGFLESVFLFEALVEQLRRPQAVLLSVQQAGTATMLVVLAAFVLAVLLPARMQSSESHAAKARWLAVGALGAFAFAVVGGLLNEYTSIPFVTSLFPFRQLWLLALGALAAVGLVVERLLQASSSFPGVLPGVAGLLFLRWMGSEVGNSVIGLALIGGLIVLWKPYINRLVEGRGLPGSEIARGVRASTHGGLPLLLVFASAVLLSGPISAARLPTVSLDASLRRIALESGQLDRDVIESAQAAERLVQSAEAILVPVRPSSWTAFELISGHPTAFDFNVFLGTQDWYERFRRMCDPGYRFDPDDDFSAVGLQDIVTCAAGHGPDEIRAVARSLGVSYGVVPTAQWDGSGVLHTTSSGAFVLVRFGAD